jgi:hypothetical protein
LLLTTKHAAKVGVKKLPRCQRGSFSLGVLDSFGHQDLIIIVSCDVARITDAITLICDDHEPVLPEK